MKKPWNDSDLARLSAYLDRQLAAALDRLEPGKALNLKAGQEEDQDIDLTLGPEARLPGSAEAREDWLEPELLGEPEVPAGLTPEAVRELSRIIEAAVEKGVAAALAKIKG